MILYTWASGSTRCSKGLMLYSFIFTRDKLNGNDLIVAIFSAAVNLGVLLTVTAGGSE